MASINTGGTLTSASQETLAPIVHGPGQGEHLWVFGGLTTIKADGAETGGRVMVTEQLAPHGSGSPLHIHHNEDEWFYVLECELTIWVAAPEIPPTPTAPAGHGANAPSRRGLRARDPRPSRHPGLTATPTEIPKDRT